MAALISHTTFDGIDAYAMSVFWGGVLGFAEDPDDPNEPGDEECLISSADGTDRLLFKEVPDTKQVKTVSTWTSSRLKAPVTRSSRAYWAWEPAKSKTYVARTDLGGSCFPTRKATSSAYCAATPNAPRRPDCKR